MADEQYLALERIKHNNRVFERGDLLRGVDAASLAELVRVRAVSKLGEANVARNLGPMATPLDREQAAREAAEAEVLRLKAQVAALQQAAADGHGGGATITLAAQAEAQLTEAETALARSDEQSAAADAATKGAAGAVKPASGK